MTSAAKANRNAEIVDRLEAENTRLRAALKDLFLLACVSQDIDAGCKQMKAAGKLIAAPKQPGAT
jgi:hypothetical protein